MMMAPGRVSSQDGPVRVGAPRTSAIGSVKEMPVFVS
jgi:hypothetical protein